MGQQKQLLPLGNKPVIRHCLDTIITAGIKDIIVVLGLHAEKVLKVLDDFTFEQIIPPHPPCAKGRGKDFTIKTAYNENPESEMVESVRIGLHSLDGSSSGVLVCLSDHPLVSSQTLKTLVDLHREDPDKIIIPEYKGTRGHPTLFPVNAIRDVFTGSNLREISNKYPERIRFADLSDEGIILDMDTMEDYRRFSERTIID